MRVQRGEAGMRTKEQERIYFNWITTGEAGRRLGGIDSEQVRKLGKRKKIRMRNVNEGGKQPSWMVDPASVEEYNRRNTIEPEADAA